MVGVFQDVVELNNIRMDSRTEMKRAFEQATTEFVTSAVMIFSFLFAVIAIFDIVRQFYLYQIIGNIVIAIDILLLVGEFVYNTYLRATEL